MGILPTSFCHSSYFFPILDLYINFLRVSKSLDLIFAKSFIFISNIGEIKTEYNKLKSSSSKIISFRRLQISFISEVCMRHILLSRTTGILFLVRESFI